eukprot:TRINITY_DN26314_c0_g1_i1.p1 TRINITY_DN26314_c0_g1~~TRINITY_DN26314_c0_g1_i1.p1  ORF type:complete len:626 (-),score=135.36 TRINITY_DN26314_c0_g1_i1:88-1920(-)
MASQRRPAAPSRRLAAPPRKARARRKGGEHAAAAEPRAARRGGLHGGAGGCVAVAATPEASPIASVDQNGPLRDLIRTSAPSEAQVAIVEACLGHVHLLAQHVLGEGTAVVVQGSYAQGLAVRSSDLDVALIQASQDDQNPSGRHRGAPTLPAKRRRGANSQDTTPAPDAVDRRRAVAHLRAMADAIVQLQSPEVKVALRIFSARVPVLRLHCQSLASSGSSGSSERIVVDVSVGESLRRGACDRCVHTLLAREPSGIAAALCRLVKLWAKRRRLTDTLKGGLSSFAFVLLTVFFLQRPGASPKADGSSHRPSAAWLPPHERVCGREPSEASPELSAAPELLGTAAHAGGASGRRGMRFTPKSLPCESSLVRLLSGFFAWAAEELPMLRGSALSVATGKASARPGGATSKASAVTIAVPFAPEDNAARCLRSDVWERSVLPELLRAQRLASKLQLALESSRGGRPRRNSRQEVARVARALFADVGTERGRRHDAEAEASEKGAEAQNSPLHSPAGAEATEKWRAGRKGRRLSQSGAAALGENYEREVEAERGASPQPPQQQRRPKRRRRDSSRSPPAAAGERVPASANAAAEAAAAPVQRWLGLRSLLCP